MIQFIDTDSISNEACRAVTLAANQGKTVIMIIAPELNADGKISVKSSTHSIKDRTCLQSILKEIKRNDDSSRPVYSVGDRVKHDLSRKEGTITHIEREDAEYSGWRFLYQVTFDDGEVAPFDVDFFITRLRRVIKPDQGDKAHVAGESLEIIVKGRPFRGRVMTADDTSYWVCWEDGEKITYPQDMAFKKGEWNEV